MTAGSVLFLIRSLHAGGAERQLVTLAIGLHSRGRAVHVATFYPDGELARELESAGVRVTSLGKRGRWDIASPAARLIRLVRRERPAVLHPYLPDPNLLATLLRPLFPRLRLVWGVRAAYVDMSKYDVVARIAFSAAALASRGADLIIVNSRAGEAYHAARGYPRDRLRVVPNGIDTGRFRPDPEGRERLRTEWGVPREARLVGSVARLDPLKDHATFMRAAAGLADRDPNVRFVCVGGGPESYARELRRQASDLGLDDRLWWAGARSDLPAVYSALDVFTSTSVGEGFPNVVAEAMACGTPCAVTDAGDSAWIVDGLGEVVPVGDHAALIAAWQRILSEPAGPRSAAVRERIVREFSVERLITATECLLWGSPGLSKSTHER
jgi:glycosyltransferase involved in cell wall biosynthesis